MNFKDGSRNGGWGCLAVVGVLLLIAIACGFAMVLGALGIGAANAWFLDGQFSDAWHAAWAKPLVLLGWTVLFYGIIGALIRSSD